MPQRDAFTFRRWIAANAVVVGALFVAGVAVFAVVAGRLDVEFAQTARKEHLGAVIWTHLVLLPAYTLIWALHSSLSYPLARRRWRKRVDQPPGFLRLVWSAAGWNFVVFILSLGPVTYIGPGSLDSLAWIATVAISPSVDLYLFKTWHIQEFFTVLFAGMAFLAAWDLVRGLLAATSGWGRYSRVAVTVFVGSLLGAPFGWFLLEGREPDRKSTDLPNIIIVGSDSLRADHFGFRGYGRQVSPNIDRLASEGVDLENFYVSTASTLESWTSFLTGKYPANHGIRYMFISPEQAKEVSEDPETLPRLLKEVGYSSSVVGDWAANCFSVIDFGFDRTLTSDVQNLDVFLFEVAFRTHLLIPHYFSHALGELLIPHMRQVTGYMNSGSLTSRFLDELDDASEKGRPFLGVLFLSCTHLPYMSSHPYNVKFADPAYRGPNRFRLNFDVDDFIQDGFADAHGPEEKQHVIDLYDGGVAEFDSHVGRIMEHLERTGLGRNTILIVTSDHGEDLYEPGTTLGHGTSFFGGDQSNRIPMIMRMPGGRYGGRRIPQITRSIDLMPTLLEIVGQGERVGGMDGVSLSPYISGRTTDLELMAPAETCYLFFPKKVPGEQVYSMEPADRTLFIDPEFNNQFVLKPKYHDYVIETKDRMIRTARWKLVYIKGRQGPIYRLYDMKRDPRQLEDLSNAGLPVFEPLKERLHRWMEKGEDPRWPRHLDN